LVHNFKKTPEIIRKYSKWVKMGEINQIHLSLQFIVFGQNKMVHDWNNSLLKLYDEECGF
jgi:hypothetical protein